MKRTALILSVGLALLTALPAAAQTPTTENLATPGATFEVGRFVSMTSDSITLTLRNGEQRTILIDAATVGTDKTFEAGAWVQVDYKMEDDGRAVATLIQARAGSPPSAPVVTHSEPILPEPEAAEAPEAVTEPAPAPEASEPVVEEEMSEGVEEGELLESPAPKPESEVAESDWPAPAPTETLAETEVTEAETAPVEDELPQTASELPLIALLGLLGVGGAVALRSLR